jgi:hypothetical protein
MGEPKKVAGSSDVVLTIGTVRSGAGTKNGRCGVARIRWMPRSAAAMISSRVSPAGLANSVSLRLAHGGSTGLGSARRGTGVALRGTDQGVGVLGALLVVEGELGAAAAGAVTQPGRPRWPGPGPRTPVQLPSRPRSCGAGPVWQLVQADAADPAASRPLDRRAWPKPLTKRPVHVQTRSGNALGAFARANDGGRKAAGGGRHRQAVGGPGGLLHPRAGHRPRGVPVRPRRVPGPLVRRRREKPWAAG